MWKTLRYFNERGQLIQHEKVEVREQELAEQYVKPEDCVLELGARYGTVSCCTNKKLIHKHKHAVVEPDSKVWEALETNKKLNECKFFIVKGFVSKKKHSLVQPTCGYATRSKEDGTSTIYSIGLDELQESLQMRFTVLIADCEGFLETFLDENPFFLDQLRCIFFEKDNPGQCNYDKIKKTLVEKGFTQEVDGFHEIWLRNSFKEQ
jgi:FkbM family methyltransferase